MSTGIDEKTKNKIIRIAQAIVPDAKIILYGSRARGDFSSSSDIDIALDTGVKIRRLDVSEIRDMLEASHILHKIDVVDLNALPEEMKKTILKEGIVWKD